ncbi:MAG: 4a-hydroxytetrahydrobiopterin dehydratase [Dehalococcoidia bacterium]|nr:4a-hydroxytetrahydrobiopterin dehydratase [Dehalococcoidia bacterium]
MTESIMPTQFSEAEGVEDWRVVGDGARAYFATTSFAEGARFVQALATRPALEAHPPDVDLRPRGVSVRLITYTDDLYGISQLDVDAARAISGVARQLGLASDPSRIHSQLVVPGALDIAAIMPFWQAALGYEPRRDNPAEDLVDPSDRGVPFWFEQMEEPRGDGGGAIHFAVWLPHEEAEARVAAALAAGGRIVRDGFAPSWWTLADPAGNEIDIATITGRD